MRLTPMPRRRPAKTPRALGRRVASVLPERLPAESLLRIPLVRQALTDPRYGLVPRAVDHDWRHEKILDHGVSGFNPFSQAYYYGSRSPFAAWLRDPVRLGRELNEGNWLVKEVLFLAHDYLHAWAYRAIDALAPGLGVGRAPIGRRNFEALVFAHLLTEACATVGLDYWFLSLHPLNTVVDLGASVNLLSVSYRERDLDEYRKFNAGLTVQAPEFYSLIARFYCDGEFPGFGVDDLRRSPKLHDWLSHELNYGELQRKYIRLWLSYLSGGAVVLSEAEAVRPLVCGLRWQVRLMAELGQLLWEKVKEDRRHELPAGPGAKEAWTARGRAPLDFRFVNLNRVLAEEGPEVLKSWRPGADYPYFFSQLLSRFELRAVPRELLPVLRLLRGTQEIPSLLYLLRELRPIAQEAAEPWDLMMFN